MKIHSNCSVLFKEILMEKMDRLMNMFRALAIRARDKREKIQSEGIFDDIFALHLHINIYIESSIYHIYKMRNEKNIKLRQKD